MEFHISRHARQKYQFDESIFSTNGNVIFANFHAGRLFAQRINQVRDAAHYPDRAVKAGQINAMGLIDEILHYVISLYRTQHVSQVNQKALQVLEKRLGKRDLNKALTLFCAEFPPREVMTKRMSVEEYLKGSSNGISHRAMALEEMLILWVANQNPAFSPYL